MLWMELEGFVEDVKLGVRPKRHRDETSQTALGIFIWVGHKQATRRHLPLVGCA